MATYNTYISVALPIPVETAFTYSVPTELVPRAEAGRRVLVPFGQRILTGFILAVSGNPGDVPPDKIKPVQDIPDDEPVVDQGMIDLAKWIADYYLSSTGEALKSAVPAGSLVRSRIRVYPEDTASTDGLSRSHVRILGHLRAHGPALMRSLERTFGRETAGAVRSLANRGAVRLEREMTAPAARVKTERRVLPVSSGESPAFSSRARKQEECLSALKNHPDGIALTEFLERYGFTRGVVNALVEAGYAMYEEAEVTRHAAIPDASGVRSDHPLTPAQETCIRIIRKEALSTSPRPVLLYGVTGSGKTRVYIELVRDALEKGKGAIILVPEISLTPQTARFFSSAFPGRVAVFHSAMSPGERLDSWRLIREGSLDVVIGPRSAIFSPVSDTGVIIVDEEHDQSYKQTDSNPRYHARDVAVMRARMLGIPVVLGSATPSLESWNNALSGKYILARLPERVESRPLPAVVCVNMREERNAGNFSSLSVRLREELAARIVRGEKSIILINRRGYSTGVVCKDCGHVVSCPDCSAGLVWHASKRLAVCHLCGKSRVVLKNCPECGADSLVYRGTGTQRIEHDIAAAFPDVGIIRMDSDSTTAHDAHHRILEEFRTGPASILIGTQMVGKGHDIPDVSLVGVIAADAALSLPDFRASERTFQLITQVAGRAGRGDSPGMVVVQAHNTEMPAVAAACAHDFEAFAYMELPERRELDFPPFVRLVLIEISGEDRVAALKRAGEAESFLAERIPHGSESFGPIEAPVPRVKGRYRYHILLKTHRPSALKPVLRELADSFRGPETIIVDVDPSDML